MPPLLSPLGSIPRALSAAAADLRRGAEAAAALPDLVRGLLGAVEGLRGDLRTGLSGLQEDVGALQGELHDGVGGLRSDVQELHREIARLRTLPGGIAELQHQLARVEKSVAPVQGLERELRDGVAVVIARLDLLLDGIGAMRADLSSAREDIAPVDDDLASVERAVKDMAPALGDVRDEITALRDDLSSLPLVGRKPTPDRSRG